MIAPTSHHFCSGRSATECGHGVLLPLLLMHRSYFDSRYLPLRVLAMLRRSGATDFGEEYPHLCGEDVDPVLAPSSAAVAQRNVDMESSSPQTYLIRTPGTKRRSCSLPSRLDNDAVDPSPAKMRRIGSRVLQVRHTMPEPRHIAALPMFQCTECCAINFGSIPDLGGGSAINRSPRPQQCHECGERGTLEVWEW